MTIKVDAVIIGAGIVGLACARSLSRVGISTIVLEKNTSFGQEASSRNSEVIHAGLYYPNASLKAKLCVRGRHLIYDYCNSNNIKYNRIGKLVVANGPYQEEKLHSIMENGRKNGVEDLKLITALEAQKLEPEIKCASALFSPSTGIVDSHSLMQAILVEAESNGAILACNCIAESVKINNHYFYIQVSQHDNFQIKSKILINSAGLNSQDLANVIEGFPSQKIPKLYLAKGNYYSYSGKLPFSRLIYPVPEPGGLGVHLTVDLSGRGRFGPDVEWLDKVDYSVNTKSVSNFYEEIRKYWPGLPQGKLMPDYAGIRSKIVGPNMPDSDFLIQDSSVHGIKNLVNLFGIESPGLTSSMAIAEKVLSIIEI